MMMVAARIMLLPVGAESLSGATFWACKAAGGGPAEALFVAGLLAQLASNNPATLPWPNSRCLDFLRTERRLAARAPQTAGRYLSPAAPLGQAPTRRATPVGPSAAPAAWRY
jgi:hypothetical protein